MKISSIKQVQWVLRGLAVCLFFGALVVAQGVSAQSTADLDNCPAGPYGVVCYDAFGVQIPCANPEQFDRNNNLVGDICDLCGNGIVDAGEQCDYGTPNRCTGPNNQCNTNIACTPANQAGATCQFCDQRCRLHVVSLCGNGRIDFHIGEQCDDGNRQGDDGCESDCRLPSSCSAICDRNTLDAAGNPLNQNACSGNYACLTAGETNAPGSLCRNPGCPTIDGCTCIQVCGNGVREGTEQCDDGNTANGDGCNSQCRFEGPTRPGCGNGQIDNQEVCDPTFAGDPNASQCKADCSGYQDCQPQSGTGMYQEEGGLLVMEVESEDPVTGWTPFSSDGNTSGSFYRDQLGTPSYNNPDPNTVLTYRFTITNPGQYSIRLRAQQPGDSNCPIGNDGQSDCDKENDAWLRVDGGDWLKYYTSGSLHGQWSCDGTYEHHGTHSGPTAGAFYLNPYTFSAGEHTISIAARSGGDGGGSGYGVDRILVAKSDHQLYNNPGAVCLLDGSVPESTREGAGTDSCPTTPVGDFNMWSSGTLTFTGPQACETDTPSPFLDYRLDVVFTPVDGGETVRVPGYFAGDGNGGACGTVWRAHFTPPKAGQWSYTANFYQGTDAALGIQPPARTPTTGLLSPASGSIAVGGARTDLGSRDFNAKGSLRYVGEHYLRFDNGEYFLKGGANSPEVLLGWSGFDGSVDSSGDGGSSWINLSAHGGLYGAVDYLVSNGMNVMYMLAMNVAGDGRNVWPWVGDFRDVNKGGYVNDSSRMHNFDISRLEDWREFFEYMNSKGVVAHLVLSEIENQALLGTSDGQGGITRERALMYRELIARFGHNQGIIWNIGEENGVEYGGCNNCHPANSDDDRRAFMRYISELDPYDHHITFHTVPGGQWQYNNVNGNEHFTGPSIQTWNEFQSDTDIRNWRNTGRTSEGTPWVVMLDEVLNVSGGGENTGLAPNNQQAMSSARRNALWPSLLGGAGGVEWYHQGDQSDVDWNGYGNIWNYTRYALETFKEVPYWRMWPRDWARDPVTETPGNNDVTPNVNDFVFGNDGEYYIIYRENNNGDTQINLPAGNYTATWINARTGQRNAPIALSGGTGVSYGSHPDGEDWAILIINDAATSAVCGDGVKEGTEQCDDGNTFSDDGCSATCTIEAITVAQCGNGQVEEGEQCDDGNTANGDGCNAQCETEEPIVSNAASCFNFGFAMDAESMLWSGDQAYKDRYRQVAADPVNHYNLTVAENAMKPILLQPNPGDYQWQAPDEMLSFAHQNGMAMRFHTYLWASQTPGWMTAGGSQQDEQIFRDHVSTTLNHITSNYPGTLKYIDVVNESANFGTGGWDFAGDTEARAFEIVKEYAPDDVKLFYNDFNIWSDNNGHQDRVLNLVNRINSTSPGERLVDGVGFQLHLGSGWKTKDQAAQMIRKFTDQGYEVHFTEADHANDANQLLPFLEACLENTMCTGFTTWGLSDRHTWRGYKVMFDTNQNPKDAMLQARDMLNNIESRFGRELCQYPAVAPAVSVRQGSIGEINTPSLLQRAIRYFREAF